MQDSATESEYRDRISKMARISSYSPLVTTCNRPQKVTSDTNIHTRGLTPACSFIAAEPATVDLRTEVLNQERRLEAAGTGFRECPKDFLHGFGLGWLAIQFQEFPIVIAADHVGSSFRAEDGSTSVYLSHSQKAKAQNQNPKPSRANALNL